MVTDWRLKFKGYAEAHIDIQHNDVSNKVFLSGWNQLNGKTLPALIVVYRELPTNFTGPNNDSVVIKNNFEIMFLKTVKKDRYDDEEAAYKFCNQLALDFMSKLREERGLPHGNANRIASFNITECRIEKYALLDTSNRFGVSLFCSPGDAEPVIYNPDRWLP